MTAAVKVPADWIRHSEQMNCMLQGWAFTAAARTKSDSEFASSGKEGAVVVAVAVDVAVVVVVDGTFFSSQADDVNAAGAGVLTHDAFDRPVTMA